MLQVSWTVPIKVRRMEITGTKGYVEVDLVRQEVEIFDAIDWKDLSDFNEYVARFGDPATTRMPVPRVEPLRLELESFLESVRANQTPEVDGATGLSAVRCALEARQLIRARLSVSSV
jgi:predicted dehydrogenase